MLSYLPTVFGIIVFLAMIIIYPSIRVIGPTEVGLVMKRFGKKLTGDNPIAFLGEAGYQAQLLMPVFVSNYGFFSRLKNFPGYRFLPMKLAS